jgi:hypothetical protein
LKVEKCSSIAESVKLFASPRVKRGGILLLSFSTYPHKKYTSRYKPPNHIQIPIYIIRPMNSASEPATISETIGFSVAAAPVVVGGDELLVSEDGLDPVPVDDPDPVPVELEGMELPLPPSIVMPGRFWGAWAARAV